MTKTAACLCYFGFLFILNCRTQILNDKDDHSKESNDTESHHWYQYQEPIPITQLTDADVILDCNKACNKDGPLIKWKFLPCDNYRCCYKNVKWKTLNPGKQNCRYKISKSKKFDSGFYKCTNNDTTIKTFHVTIVSKTGKEPPPNVLELDPKNLTVTKNEPIIIHCKVKSDYHPYIWWFKQNNGTQSDVVYNNHSFHKLNTDTDVLYKLPDTSNVYMVKLIINSAAESDSGNYACTAVSWTGSDIGYAYVQVKSDEVNVQNWYDWESMTIPVLFLVSFAFILLPITVWACCFIKRKKNVRTNSDNGNGADLIKLVLQTNDINTANVPFARLLQAHQR